MNKDRRKRIGDLMNRIEIIKGETEDILSEEQGGFDNLPERLQQADRGQGMEEVINGLEEAVNALDEAYNGLDSAMSTGG